jgi:hypothetical protein
MRQSTSRCRKAPYEIRPRFFEFEIRSFLRDFTVSSTLFLRRNKREGSKYGRNLNTSSGRVPTNYCIPEDSNSNRLNLGLLLFYIHSFEFESSASGGTELSAVKDESQLQGARGCLQQSGKRHTYSLTFFHQHLHLHLCRRCLDTPCPCQQPHCSSTIRLIIA